MRSVYLKILSGFVAVMMLVLVLGGLSYFYVADFERLTNEMTSKNLKSLMYAEKLSQNIQTRISAIRGYMILEEGEYLDRFVELTRESVRYEKDLMKMANAQHQKQLKDLIDRSNAWKENITEDLIPTIQNREMEVSMKVMRLQITPEGEEISKGFEKIAADLEKQMNAKSQQISEQGKWLKSFVLILSASTLLGGTIISLFISRSIANPLRKVATRLQAVASGELGEEPMPVTSKDEIGQLIQSANLMAESFRNLILKLNGITQELATFAGQLNSNVAGTTSSANEISAMMEEVAVGSEKQISSMEESVRSLEEMATGIQRIAETSGIVAESAMQSAQEAKEGNRIAQQTIGQMNSISVSVQESSGSVQRLGERSREIEQIVNAISQIASQTNLLALNAAIEAARAGEQGRGFSVVADEVRKLAEESEAFARQIGELIQEIQGDISQVVASMEVVKEDVNRGIDMVSASGRSFEHILRATEDVAQQIQEVSAVSEEIAASSQQVTATVESTSSLAQEANVHTQNTVKTVEQQLTAMKEIAQSAQMLNDMAQSLKEEISRYRV